MQQYLASIKYDWNEITQQNNTVRSFKEYLDNNIDVCIEILTYFMINPLTYEQAMDMATTLKTDTLPCASFVNYTPIFKNDRLIFKKADLKDRPSYNFIIAKSIVKGIIDNV